VTGGPTAGLKAIATAADAIGLGRAEVVLAGGAEELAFEAWVGFAACGWIAESSNGTDPCNVPFGAGRNGFLLGEAAALLVLESDETAAARDVRPLGRIRGHGSAFDPSRGSDPEAAANALARAIQIALDSAELKPAEIDLVSSSASGSVVGDRAEAKAIAHVLGNHVPVMAVKSGLGECLGAAGALQTLALLGVAANGEMPGIAGLQAVAKDIPLTGLSAFDVGSTCAWAWSQPSASMATQKPWSSPEVFHDRTHYRRGYPWLDFRGVPL
jgi:3-oxoacyl-[acyl-carrier-protein] synthase II